jgi:KaiC/GvpD/RAD55 family RecA-like ATPase
MKEIKQLRYLLEHPDTILSVQQEVFHDTNLTIFNQMKVQLENGLTPTIQSLGYALPELTNDIEQIGNEPLIDNSTFQLIHKDLLQIAYLEFGDTLAMLDWSQPKQQELVYTRLQALRESSEPEVLGLGTDFFDVQHHIAELGIQCDSGFSFLDHTGSGLEKGQLATVLAPSNNGKSTLLTAIARNMYAKKLNVLYMAFEETKSDFFIRIARGLVKKTAYQYSQLTVEDLKELWNSNAQSKLGTLTVLTGEEVHVERLNEIVEQNEKVFGIKYDAVFIDYSSHLSVKANKEARDDQRISKIFRQLKQFANTAGKERVVVTAVQANREGYKNTLTADKAADSLGGIRESDLVLGIRLNPSSDNETITPENDSHDRKTGEFEINVIKRRKGTLQIQSKYYYDFLASNLLRETDEDRVAEINLNGFTQETAEVLNTPRINL